MQAEQEKLKGFEQAPERVQKAFWDTVRKRTDWERELSRFQEGVGNSEAAAPIELRRREPPRAKWDERWRRRAESAAYADRMGLREDGDFERQRDWLMRIFPADYVEKLTGEEVDPSRKILCPFHEDRNGSLHVYFEPERGWYCFGCGAAGGIYHLAGRLWGLQTHGPDFREIQARLLALFQT